MNGKTSLVIAGVSLIIALLSLSLNFFSSQIIPSQTQDATLRADSLELKLKDTEDFVRSSIQFQRYENETIIATLEGYYENLVNETVSSTDFYNDFSTCLANMTRTWRTPSITRIDYLSILRLHNTFYMFYNSLRIDYYDSNGNYINSGEGKHESYYERCTIT